MPYRITITIPESRLSAIMAALPKGIKAEIERAGDDAPRDSASALSSFLSLGDKVPREGSVSEKVCKLLMILEKKHGPHAVTRAQLNEAMKKAKFPETQLGTAVSYAITSGFMKYRETNDE